MKYTEWLNLWLNNYVKTSNKRRTLKQYLKVAELHILPNLGDFELADITPFALQKFVTELTISGNRRTGGGLSPNFIKTIISMVQNSLKTAHTRAAFTKLTARQLAGGGCGRPATFSVMPPLSTMTATSMGAATLSQL